MSFLAKNYKSPECRFEIICRKQHLRKPVISIKCFIHSPAKKKAKTSIIEFWPYQLIRWWYLGTGLLIKHDVRSRNVGTKNAIWVKYPLPFFIIISKANIAYLFHKIKKKFSYSEKKYPKNDKLKRIWNLYPKAFEKSKANATAKRFRTSSTYLQFCQSCAIGKLYQLFGWFKFFVITFTYMHFSDFFI